MSGPERIYLAHLGNIASLQRRDGTDIEYIRADLHEAVVRELENVRTVKDSMIRIAKDLGEQCETLRALLDEAPHAQDCDYLLDVSMEYTLPYNCYKARLPREGG